MYSQVVHQPSGIRRFWFGVRLLSPLRPILRNGNPLLKFLGNVFTAERVLQRPTPRELALNNFKAWQESAPVLWNKIEGGPPTEG